MRKHNLIGLAEMKRTDPTYDIKILKAILNDPQFLSKIRKDITPELFERQAMAMCYKLVKAHSFINNIDDLIECVKQLDIDEANKLIIFDFIEELKAEYVGNEDIIKTLRSKHLSSNKQQKLLRNYMRRQAMV